MAQGAVGIPRVLAQSLGKVLVVGKAAKDRACAQEGMPARVQSKGSIISLLRKPPRFSSGKTKSASAVRTTPRSGSPARA
jgi:hypothetical protein